MLNEMQLSVILGSDYPLLSLVGETEIVGLTADSRDVRPGFLFAALPGVATDGARFVPQALKMGAAAILAPEGSGIEGKVGVPVIADANPRRRLALMSARFFARQPETIVAVTGTNGKTSVATFARQIWQQLGMRAASVGTLGISTAKGERSLGVTTPDPVTLHKVLAEMADDGITHVAMEASSHGLAQYRLDGVRLKAAAFTNISRDHLDYHENFEAYAYAKMRLFGEVLAPGGVAVLNADTDYFADLEAVSWARGHRLISVGARGRDIRLASLVPQPRGQCMEIVHAGTDYRIDLPLVGNFQASNALIAAGLVIACGGAARDVFAALASLGGAPGRLEEVAHLPLGAQGASVFVDYAHTPDALKTALSALRPHTDKKLVVVFGCGGDRDRGKRPQMGAIAAAEADVVFVTDDNPRGEDPADIRAEIMAACPGATEIADRGAAIDAAMKSLQAGDLLVVAGKGHETGQIIGERVVPFSDRDTVRRIAGQMGEAS